MRSPTGVRDAEQSGHWSGSTAAISFLSLGKPTRRHEFIASVGDRVETLQQPPNHHLAELDIGRIRYEIDDPGMAVSRTTFIWRFVDESGDATDTRPYADPRIIVNVSVWESVDGLERFVWQTVHKRFYGSVEPAEA